LFGNIVYYYYGVCGVLLQDVPHKDTQREREGERDCCRWWTYSTFEV